MPTGRWRQSRYANWPPKVPRTVLLDANLIVLLVVGSVDRRLIAQHRRLRAYEVRDYLLLLEALSGYDGITSTPNLLTEASNLLRQIPEPQRGKFAGSLAMFIVGAEEIFIQSRVASRDDTYRRLGLADAGVVEIGRRGCDVLTADFGLYDVLARGGSNVRNFNHLRASAFGL